MKLNAGKRILMFFHWLMSLMICAAFTLYLVKRDWITGLYDRVTGSLTETQIMMIGIAILAVYVILSVLQACVIFQRGKRTDRGFITVDSSDAGRVRIAVSAIEQMVRQSVTSVDGINDMKIAIDSLDDAINITIAATLQSGSHVPTVTMNMQRAIRQFVEMNCGVAVRSVSISINSVTAAPELRGRKGRKAHAEIPPMPAPVVEPAEPVNPEPMYSKPASADPAASEPVQEATASERASESEVSGETSTPDDYEDGEAQEVPVIGDPEPIRLHFDHLTEDGYKPVDEAIVGQDEQVTADDKDEVPEIVEDEA